MRTFLRLIVVVLAALLLPAAVGGVNGVSAARGQYAPPEGAAAPAAVAPLRPHDPDKPTAVVVVGGHGGEASDVLAPFEVLAVTDAFNVYTVAPERRPLPLTGGLHLVPDLSFGELGQRLGAQPADVVVVPQMPDAGQPSTAPVTEWLRQQADGGALMVSVCAGARVLASAGLLDGRDATSHWIRISGLERDHPEVNWVRGTRYVDGGDVITTGGLLSSIDGTLRVVERLVSTDAARRAAEAVGWRHYSPGGPAVIPVWTFGPDAVLRPLNAAYRRTRVGVLLTDGVGEIELASVFDTYNGQSFAARTVAVAAGADAVTSRHGLVFVPTSDLHGIGDDLDRLVVPGAGAARRRDPDLAAHAIGEHGLTPEYVHAEPGFPFEPALRDLAATVDLPTAKWTAKLLEYPVDDLRLTGPAWPWPIVMTPLLLALLAGLAVIVAFTRIRGDRHGPLATPTSGGDRRAAAHGPAHPGSAGQATDPHKEEVMTTIRPARPTWRAALMNRAFVVHYLQMLAAMLAGMALYMPLSMLVGDTTRTEVDALLMATSMTAGMAAWMTWRRHAWPAIAEMGLAMYLAFAVLFPFLWLGALSAQGLFVLGHVLMLPAMALAMLRRREEYLGAQHA